MVSVPRSPTPARNRPATFHEAIREWLETSPPADQKRPPPVPRPYTKRMTPPVQVKCKVLGDDEFNDGYGRLAVEPVWKP